MLQQSLLKAKDVTFAGDETGLLKERLLYLWHCDAILLLLLLLLVLCAMFGLALLTKQILVVTGFLEEGRKPG